MPQPTHPVHQGHHPRYKVTHQEESVELTPQGEQHKIWTVHLEHENGVKGTVTLPDSQYTAQNVHMLASDQAHEVHRIAGLPDSLPPDEQTPGQ